MTVQCPIHKALVTGATGFIGRSLVSALLDSGVAVKCLVRDEGKVPDAWRNKGVETVVGDLGDPDSLARVCEQVDTVIHAAGDAHAWQEQSASYMQRQWRVNAQGTKALVEAAGKCGVQRFVFISSVAAGGEVSDTGADEEWPGEPETPYGQAKLAAEQYVLEAGHMYGMHVTNLRPPLVYGPGLKGNLARMLEAVEQGRFPSLPETGNKRSMIHVEDLARAAILAAQQPEANGRTFITTDGRAYSTRQIYEWMCRALGRPIPSRTIPLWLLRGIALVGDVVGWLLRRRFVFDSEAMRKLTGSAWYDGSKARLVLGFKAVHDLESDLPAIVAEYRRIGG